MLKLFLLFILAVCGSGFTLNPASSPLTFTSKTTVSFSNDVSDRAPQTSTSLNVFGTKKKALSPEDQARIDSYWEGDWVCKDCGYVYNRDECAGFYFEEQGAGFRCPQCSGPRRRYAKKVGDVVGTTLDGGDAPILLFSFGGMAATIAFGIWAVDNL
ncbi:hypothetical protein TrLO_g13622 [Triparma laevis f. longispina]|uniref:Rubredoxin-like domain-containing protein n=1 Tax=Triparma laevis f. longispina TaxID=1714387 RepID=A0A9W7E0G7_9STRA|nr:hypothetical protein TrLO_g13622 [Triparma laevis f. longispina]